MTGQELKIFKIEDLKKSSQRFRIQEKSETPKDCAKAEDLKFVVLRKKLRWQKAHETIATVPVQLKNITDKTIKICRSVYSHTPFVPLGIITFHHETELRETLGHGSGFGPSYYPDTKEDTVEHFTFELPAHSILQFEAYSRSLEQYYRVKSPKLVEVRLNTSLIPTHSEIFSIEWDKIPSIESK